MIRKDLSVLFNNNGLHCHVTACIVFVLFFVSRYGPAHRDGGGGKERPGPSGDSDKWQQEGSCVSKYLLY
jgi:hypothetical protein